MIFEIIYALRTIFNLYSFLSSNFPFFAIPSTYKTYISKDFRFDWSAMKNGENSTNSLMFLSQESQLVTSDYRIFGNDGSHKDIKDVHFIE